jgi:hypothetical protein
MNVQENALSQAAPAAGTTSNLRGEVEKGGGKGERAEHALPEASASPREHAVHALEQAKQQQELVQGQELLLLLLHLNLMTLTELQTCFLLLLLMQLGLELEQPPLHFHQTLML